MPKRKRKKQALKSNSYENKFIYKAVLVPVINRKDGISPGRLVAIAEWRAINNGL